MKQAIWALLSILIIVLGACAADIGGTTPAQVPILTVGQWSYVGSIVSYVYDKGGTGDTITTISYVCGQDHKSVVHVFQASAVSSQNDNAIDITATTQTILFPNTLSPIEPFALTGTIDTGTFINATTGGGKDLTLIPTVDEVKRVVNDYDEKYCA
jgi:hypothetical protein